MSGASAPRYLRSMDGLAGRVIESMPDLAVVALDRGGRITSWNAAAAQLTGVTRDAALGRDLAWLCTGGEAGRPAGELLAAAAAQPQRYEGWREVPGGGRCFWCVATLFAVCDGDGEFEALVEVSRDDTGVHETASMMAAVGEALKATGTVASAQDLDLRLTWLSAVPEAFPSLDADSVLGLSDEEALGPEVAAVLAPHKQRVLATGEPARFDVPVDSETAGRRIYDNHIAPLRGPDGAITGLAAIAVDVTEQREHAGRLRESEHRLTEAEQIAEIGSWDYDLCTGVGHWSPGLLALHAMTEAELADRVDAFYDVLHPDDLARVRGIIERAAEDGGHFDFEHRVLRADGHVRLMQTRGEVFADADGRPVRMAGISRDVTDARSVQQTLQHAVAALTETAQEVQRVASPSRQSRGADDLRTLLTARQFEILGLLAEGLTNPQIAQRLYVSEATVKWHVRKILSVLGVQNRAQAAIRYLNAAPAPRAR